MADELTVDLGELLALADDLEGSHRRLLNAVEPVMSRGALNMKRDAASRVRSQTSKGYARAYPRSITYDVDRTDDSITAEVGPDKSLPQGALGNLLEYGSSNNAPLPHLQPALEKEGPRAERELIKAAVRSVLGDE